MVRFKIYLPVSVNPERGGSFYFNTGCPIVKYLREKIVPAEKGGGQCQKNNRFWKIPDKAQIEKAVFVIGLWAEFEPAAFITAYHGGGKKKMIQMNGFFVI